MTRDDCRMHFKNCGLNYSNTNELDIRTLMFFIEEEFKAIVEDGYDFQKSMKLKVRTPLKKDIKCTNKRLVHAYLKCDGSYFSKRELISFNADGFIGFCGWADKSCSQPILRAFINWCDWMSKNAV